LGLDVIGSIDSGKRSDTSWASKSFDNVRVQSTAFIIASRTYHLPSEGNFRGSSGVMPSATASGADAKSNGDAKSRNHNQGNQDRSYTIEQKAAVIRVRRCSPTAFYDILGLEEVKATVTDTEIKKAYRKLSLLTHPDKNGHEHADEAFKMVSRAFGVLSDPDKKAKYDRFGGDPDSRFGGGGPPSQSPFSGRSDGTGPMGGNGGWGDEEISPEEMFNRFFGGGMGGGFGPFGTFGSFGSFGSSASFGPPGPLGSFGSFESFGFARGSIFEQHDRWFAQARREHDEMLRRFFH
jgi:curved DNA-binding protein CbpA